MTRYKTRLVGTAVNEYIDLGLKDDRGRAVGLRFQLATVENYEVSDHIGGYKAPQLPFRLCGQATRDSEDFGAMQSFSYFATKAEREAAISKRIRETRARYAKKFG